MNPNGNNKLTHIRHWLEVHIEGNPEQIAKAFPRLLTQKEVMFIVTKSYPEQFIVNGDNISLADNQNSEKCRLVQAYGEYLQNKNYSAATIKQATTITRCMLMKDIDPGCIKDEDFDKLAELRDDKHYKYHLKLFREYIESRQAA